MTLQRLREIKKRLAKATMGPWSEDDGNVFSVPLNEERQKIIQRRIKCRLNGAPVPPHPDDGMANPLGWICSTQQAQSNFEADTDFIAHARADIEWLVRKLEGKR